MNASVAQRVMLVMIVAALAAPTSLLYRAQMWESVADSAMLGELGARIEVVEAVAARALVLAIDGEAGIVDSATVTAAVSGIDDALRAVGTMPTVGLGTEVAGFTREVERLADEIRIGNTEAARLRFSAGVAAERRTFDRAAAELGAELQAASQAAGARQNVIALLALAIVAVLALWSLVGVVISSTRSRRRGRHEDVEVVEAERIIIQLPDEPNDLPMRRRYPKVDDLGWLLGQVLLPFERRGWSADVSCPTVGVDCDPADVREIVGSVLARAERAGAERIGIVVRPVGDRVRITIADDGESVFGDDGNAVGTGPVQLRSAVRTRAEALGATLTWDRSGEVNTAMLDLPRLARAGVTV